MTGSESYCRAAEHILEDESLTADLTDAAAALLLDWGMAQVNKLAQEKLDPRLADLRRTMKRINREAGAAAPKDQVAQVQALLAHVEEEQNVEVDNGA